MPESDEEEIENRRQSEFELERRKKELGIAGYYSSQASVVNPRPSFPGRAEPFRPQMGPA